MLSRVAFFTTARGAAATTAVRLFSLGARLLWLPKTKAVGLHMWTVNLKTKVERATIAFSELSRH